MDLAWKQGHKDIVDFLRKNGALFARELSLETIEAARKELSVMRRQKTGNFQKNIQKFEKKSKNFWKSKKFPKKFKKFEKKKQKIWKKIKNLQSFRKFFCLSKMNFKINFAKIFRIWKNFFGNWKLKKF